MPTSPEGPGHYLDTARALTAFLYHWAWAMSETPEHCHLSTAGLAGLGRLATSLQEQLEQCQVAITTERRQARRGQ